MQLFITEYAREADIVTITEERVVHQLTKVLRAKVGDTFCVQGKRGYSANLPAPVGIYPPSQEGH